MCRSATPRYRAGLAGAGARGAPEGGGTQGGATQAGEAGTARLQVRAEERPQGGISQRNDPGTILSKNLDQITKNLFILSCTVCSDFWLLFLSGQ